MEKHTTVKEDGRYLIYYTFRDGSGSSCDKCVPASERTEEEVNRASVGTEMEPAARRVGRDCNS